MLLCGYALTHNQKGAVLIHAVLILPGTILHELSHWLACKLLGVQTMGISIFPFARMPRSTACEAGSSRMDTRWARCGAVSSGRLRLLSGSLVLLLIGHVLFGIPELVSAADSGDLAAVVSLVQASWQVPWFGLWFYLAFAVANSMVPSAADQESWPVVLVLTAGIALLLVLVGLQEWLAWAFLGPVSRLTLYLALAFTLATAVNLVIMLALGLVELLLRPRGLAATRRPFSAAPGGLTRPRRRQQPAPSPPSLPT